MKKSIVKVGYSLFSWLKDVGYTYESIKYFESEKSGGREWSATPRGETTEVYADGKVVITANENDGYDATLQLLDLVDDIDKDWLGNVVTADGVAEYSDGKALPKFALVIIHTQVSGDYLVEIYYETQVTARPNKNGKTSEGKFEPAFLDLNLKVTPREHDEPRKKLVMYSYKTKEIPTDIILPSPEDTTGENTESGETTSESTEGSETTGDDPDGEESTT